MEYKVHQETIFCPMTPEAMYFVFSDESEEAFIKTFEWVDKQKNAYGDMIYYIRDEKGSTALICEQDVDEYLRKKGASLVKGQSYVYTKK